MQFDTTKIEQKWKDYWKENETYKVSNDSSKPKFYILDMFPYPSGAGLHVGHPLGYIASDIYARYKTMKGFNVLHPMGFDAFGLPAEQYAIQTGVHPADSTATNIAMYKKQLNNIGFNYDWSREVNTSDPEYYKWTQQIFIMLYNSYYDTKENKAKSIDELITQLDQAGTKEINAFSEENHDISAEDWKAMSEKDRASLLTNFRLAYRKISYVNWCEELGTVLANDEVKDGVSERGGFPVEKRAMMQWSLRITAYAERLLNDLNELEWSDSLKAMQRNWIGKSSGAKVFFDLDGHEETVEIFTTRPDTIFGATYMVMAPEHDLVKQITTAEQKEEVEKYLDYVGARSDIERSSNTKSVTGAFTGGYAIHPFTGKKLQIWISEYVLKDYGSGAIMAVPSDDERDQAFAQKFDLPIVEVVDQSEYPNADKFEKKGKMINSEFLNGLEVKAAIYKATEEIAKLGKGSKTINYRLRDAIFSRQRYWGEPFPIRYDSNENIVVDENLPVELPPLDNFKPTASGKSPLARVESWVQQGDTMRETDTMPGYAGSSWYFLRYMDPKNENEFASKEALDYWQDVDIYIGGTEHAVGHLMYSRFWHKVMFDFGKVPTNEPFKKLINQGMIQGVIESLVMLKAKKDGNAQFISASIKDQYEEDQYVLIPVFVEYVNKYGSPDSHLTSTGIQQFIEWRPEYKAATFNDGNKTIAGSDIANATETFIMDTVSEVGKMSKRYFNVINPDDVVAQYGADCFRMYEMFLGPIEQSKPWDTKGIDGVSKFLRRMWSLFYNEQGELILTEESPNKEELKTLHKTIQKVEHDIKNFSFNTCVSTFMVAVNELKKLNCHKKEILAPLIQLLAPFAPFISEELWETLGHSESIHQASYPIFDESNIKEDSVTYPVCFNGKKRLEATFSADESRDAIMEKVMTIEGMDKYLEGKTPKKVIVVPGRMINIVV